MTLYAELTQNTLDAELSFTKVHVGGDNKEAKRLLYNYLVAHGYTVTEDMTILQLVRVLVGGVVAKFSINGKKVVIDDTTGARINGKKVVITNGVSISGKKIIMEDTE